MVAMLATLLFSAAFALSVWSIWITIAPRIAYMRMLLTGEAVSVMAPAAAPRVRLTPRPALRPAVARRFRAAA